MKIALTGSTGLVGSRFFDLSKNKHEIIQISSSFNVDITDRNKLWRFLEEKNPSLILHLAAKTNLDACELDKEEDIKKITRQKIYNDKVLSFDNFDSSEWKGSTSAFGVNVAGTKNIADYAAKREIKMIYISTDFVFDGEADTPYTEESQVNPIDWYGQTKYWGEETISSDALIARIAFPYGFKSNIKRDFIWTLVDLLSQDTPVSLVSDQIITPTFIDDIVNGLIFLIDNEATGIINLVGNNFLSPYEIGVAICRGFGLSEEKIGLTTRAKLYKGRARRPFKVRLENDKLRNLGFEMTDFFECLNKIKQ